MCVACPPLTGVSRGAPVVSGLRRQIARALPPPPAAGSPRATPSRVWEAERSLRSSRGTRRSRRLRRELFPGGVPGSVSPPPYSVLEPFEPPHRSAKPLAPPHLLSRASWVDTRDAESVRAPTALSTRPRTRSRASSLRSRRSSSRRRTRASRARRCARSRSSRSLTTSTLSSEARLRSLLEEKSSTVSVLPQAQGRRQQRREAVPRV